MIKSAATKFTKKSPSSDTTVLWVYKKSFSRKNVLWFYEKWINLNDLIRQMMPTVMDPTI